MKLHYIIAYLVSMVLFVSCNDDETYTMSQRDHLTMDLEELSLDTCFVGVPTPTKTFWVHNNSGTGIRISSVRLENASMSGFRANVNGIYLSPEKGYGANGIELPKNDSIRVFVEFTAPVSKGNDPMEVNDKLVFSLESGLEQYVNLKAWSWNADIVDSLVVNDNTVIETQKPLVVMGGIKVAADATLTIKGGTTLYMHSKSGIDVYGSLKIEGRENSPVTIRGDRLDKMFDYLYYDEVSGQWDGIRLHEGSKGNSIVHADIHAATTALQADSTDLVLLNTVVHNNKGYCLLSNNSIVLADNCLFSNALKDCVYINGGQAELTYCTIAQFYPLSNERLAALRFSNIQSALDYLNVTNCIITGYADDVLMGDSYEGSDDAGRAFAWQFHNCLLCTPEITDPELASYMDNVIYEKKEDEGYKDKNFELVDIDNIKYSFRPSSVSLAIGKAVPNGIVTDIVGNPRDTNTPTIGCYEYSERK